MAVTEKSPDDMMRPREVTREYRIGRERLEKLIRDGELLHLRSGRYTLIPRWCVLKWIKENVSGHPTPLTR